MDSSPVNLEQKKLLPSRRSVFVLNGTVVVAYNTNQPYPPQIRKNPDSPDLRYLHLPSYESNNVPYLCTALASPDYTGILLGRLRQTETQFPIVKICDKYMLDPTTTESWLSLEKALECISFHLVFSAFPFISLDYQCPPAPSKYGFTRTFDSRHSALNAIQKSRNAFLMLIAHVTWGAILHRARAMNKIINIGTYEDGELTVQPKRDFDLGSEEADECDLGWKRLLEHKHKLHPALVHALTQSSICDFSAKRAGLVIRRPQDWVYLQTLPYLVLSNIPVWIIWGELKARTTSIPWPRSLKEFYGPTLYEKTYAHKWTGSPETGNCHVLPSPPTFPLACAETKRLASSLLEEKEAGHPPVTFAHHVGFKEWLRSRKEEVEATKLRATPEQLHRYNQRQVEAQKLDCPGRRGAIVYEWESDERNILTRRLVTRAEVPRIWSLYGNKQRWFNCVRNEWDLCHELDPDDTPSDTEDSWTVNDDAIDIGLNDSEPMQPLTCWKETQIHRENLDINTCLTIAQIPAASNDLLPAPYNDLVAAIALDALRLLLNRFGFAFTRGSVYAAPKQKQWSLSKTMGVIGDSKGRQTFHVLDGLESSIIHFVMLLAAIGHPNATASDVPPSLCDLYPENPCYIAQVPSFIQVQTVDAGGTPLYLIHHSQDKVRQWTLAVTDPCTALMAIRLDPPTITELASGLIHSRTPFLTLKKSDPGNVFGTSRPPPKHKQRRFGLGERPLGHKLDKTDYIVYEAERVRLLENQRIARAAVKSGGILSRLVTDLIDESQILAGPSCSALEHPFTVIIEVEGEQVTFFDDSLSDEEISLLVGLYSIRAGNVHNCQYVK